MNDSSPLNTDCTSQFVREFGVSMVSNNLWQLEFKKMQVQMLQSNYIEQPN